MANVFLRFVRRLARPAAAQPARRSERGQSLILIAVGMVGLLAFVGLTIDAGTLFIGMGHLRRAVDASAIAAASQFREGRTYEELSAAARQVISLNGVDADTMQLSACVDETILVPDPDQYHDPSLCPAPNAAHRKLIKIEATTRVNFSFLALIGWFNTEIRAQAVSEAASVDVVLALDTSSSMTQDGDTTAMKNPVTCNATDPTGTDGFPGECHPFEEVKTAAVNFVSRLYYPYDRVALVTFDTLPTLHVPLTSTLSVTDTVTIIKNLEVAENRSFNSPVDCEWQGFGDDPGGCTNTSIGGGLAQAGSEFARNPVRVESVWVVILLTDGAANASANVGGDINRWCPGTTWAAQPFCRDGDSDTRHSLLPGVKVNPDNDYDPNWNDPMLGVYDSDDYAKDMADFVGCAPDEADAAAWCKDTLDYDDPLNPEGGQGALIYAVGLGRLVLNVTSGGDTDAGDKTLRYIAAVGDDGDPSTDPCATEYPVTPTLDDGENDSYSCGNYYFSEFGTGLTAVFESIASRLFTRLTR